MEDKAIRGIRWTLLGYGASRAGGLLTTFILAHLLAPGDFGVVAFGSLLVAAVVLFGTGGLQSAIVVRQDLGRPQLRSALTLAIASYLACAGVIAALSPLASELLGEDRAGEVLLGLAIPVSFGGLTAFYAGLVQRELQFSRQFVCMAGQVLGIAGTAIPLAVAGVGVWSLVLGQVAGAVVYTALLVALAPFRVRPGFERDAARTLLGSGWGFVLQGGISFVEQNADYALVGAGVGSRSLGLYSMAYRISEIPNNFLVEPIAQATFPGFARMRSRSEDVATAFLTTLRLTTLCAFPLGLIASGAAHPIVASLLGPKWSGMVGLLQILGVWGSLRIVHSTTGWFVNSMGFSSRVGMSYAAMLVVSIPALVVAVQGAGAKGAAWVMLGNVTVMVAIVGAIAHRRAGVPARRQWQAVRPSVLAALPAWLAAARAASALGNAPAGLALVASLAAGLAAYGAAVWLQDPDLPAEARAQIRRLRPAGSAVP